MAIEKIVGQLIQQTIHSEHNPVECMLGSYAHCLKVCPFCIAQQELMFSIKFLIQGTEAGVNY